jgi:ABC-2 type transport system permease protein
MQKYSQVKAMLAITKASLTAIFRSPSAVIFSFVFPFVFILVFGFIGDNGIKATYKVAFADGCDTSNAVYQALVHSDAVKVIHYSTKDSLNDALLKGKIAGVVSITKAAGGLAPYNVKFTSTTSSADKWPQFKAMIEGVINNVSNKVFPTRARYAQFDFDETNDITKVRAYKKIDFILPGQLGFSLLSSGVFGVAFMFFSLRNTLVLKRFFATPISRTYIVLGEGLSRVLFQLMTAFVIILVGYFLFGFTLIHGFETFFEMLVLSFIGLVVFMGFGFIVSGVAKSESTIPPFANLITLPQFLLAGTFFPTDDFPKWLQPISKALPLTYLNDALRAVAFEGQNLWDVRSQIAVLLIWGIIAYAAAIKVFKWE